MISDETENLSQWENMKNQITFTGTQKRKSADNKKTKTNNYQMRPNVYNN